MWITLILSLRLRLTLHFMPVRTVWVPSHTRNTRFVLPGVCFNSKGNCWALTKVSTLLSALLVLLCFFFNFMYVCYVFLNRLKDQIKDVLLCHIWLIFLSPYLVNIFGCSTSSGMSRMGGRQAIIMNSWLSGRKPTRRWRCVMKMTRIWNTAGNVVESFHFTLCK